MFHSIDYRLGQPALLKQLFKLPIVKRLASYNLFVVLSFIVQHGINKVIIMPFLAGKLGVSHFGSFVIAMSISLFLITAIPSGFTKALYREHSKLNRSEQQALFDTALTFLLVLSVGIAFIYLFAKGGISELFDDSKIAPFIPFLSGFIVCSILFSVAQLVLVINLEFRQKMIFDMIYGSMICLLIPLYFWLGKDGIGPGYFGAAFASAFSILIYLRKRQLIHRWRLAFDKLALLWRSVPSFTAGTVAMLVMTTADRWIVGYYWPEAEVTYYYVGVQIAALFVLPVTFLNTVLLPIITKRNSLDEFQRNDIKLFLTAIGASMALVFLLGYTAGPWVIEQLYGGGILAFSKTPFYIALVGQTFFILNIYAQPFVTKFYPPGNFLTIHVFSASIFVSLHLLLVPSYGIVGGAIATALAFIVLGLMYFKKVILNVFKTVLSR